MDSLFPSESSPQEAEPCDRRTREFYTFMNKAILNRLTRKHLCCKKIRPRPPALKSFRLTTHVFAYRPHQDDRKRLSVFIENPHVWKRHLQWLVHGYRASAKSENRAFPTRHITSNAHVQKMVLVFMKVAWLLFHCFSVDGCDEGSVDSKRH